jgi:hypothetical protein
LGSIAKYEEADEPNQHEHAHGKPGLLEQVHFELRRLRERRGRRDIENLVEIAQLLGQRERGCEHRMFLFDHRYVQALHADR